MGLWEVIRLRLDIIKCPCRYDMSIHDAYRTWLLATKAGDGVAFLFLEPRNMES